MLTPVNEMKRICLPMMTLWGFSGKNPNAPLRKSNRRPSKLRNRKFVRSTLALEHSDLFRVSSSHHRYINLFITLLLCSGGILQLAKSKLKQEHPRQQCERQLKIFLCVIVIFRQIFQVFFTMKIV